MNSLASVVQTFVTSLLALPLSELAQNGVDPADPISRWAKGEAAKPSVRSAGPRSATSGGRLARRSPEDVEKDIVRVVTLLQKHPDLHRAEEISSSLSLTPREMPRILGDAVASKRLVRTGKARGTRYFLPTAAKKGAAKKGAPKKVAVKKAAAKKVPKKAAPKKVAAKKAAPKPKKTATVKDATVKDSTDAAST